MKHLTREERRRIQRRSANIRFVIFILTLLSVGFAIGYTTAHACARAQEDAAAPVEVTEAPSPEIALEAAERPAWSADHPDRDEAYVQRPSSGTIPEEGRTTAADPDVLPIGSEVIICGHPYIVEDVGGAIKGNRIDIYFESHEDALEYAKEFIE